MRTLFDILDVITEDWMHGALQDGTVNVGCQCLLEAMHRKLGTPLERLEEFLKADWNYPVAVRHKMRGLYHLFDRNARDHIDLTSMKVKFLASDLLGLYAILRHYVPVLAIDPDNRAALEDELRAFEACCKAVDLILSLKQGHASQPHAARVIRHLVNELMIPSGCTT